MEEKNQPAAPDPREVVECYRRPLVQEVVEVYRHPLPEGHTASVREEAHPVRRKRKGWWIFLACLSVTTALAVGAFFWGKSQAESEGNLFGFQEQEAPRGAAEAITIPSYPFGEGVRLEIEPLRETKLTAGEIYRQVNPSVVTVMAQLSRGMSVGTGVIFREDGYILTNYHVLEGGKDCSVALYNGRSYEARYVAGDAENDLAILKVELQNLPAAVFGDSEQLRVGDPVYAIGNPLGMELRGTLTDGIVSAINRDVKVDERTMTLIQTNAALNSGNSGGPLINASGQVVGINTIKMSSSYDSIEGLGFAIPASSLQILVNDLLETGEVQPEPKLGVMVTQLGMEQPGGGWGIEVLDVTKGSAADLGGVQEGDVILSAGGIPTETSQDLLRVLRRHRLGQELTLEVLRDGARITLPVKLIPPP